MRNFLSGYKTYLVAAVAAGGAFLQSLNIISQEQWTTLISILAPILMLTLRSAIATTEAAVVAKVENVEAKVAQVAPVVANVVAAKVVSEVKAVVADAAPQAPYRTDTPRITRP